MNFIKSLTYDIAVGGGGVAGIAAAVEAARCGKKVVIIEKATQLGGLATIGLINLFVPMCNGRGIQIIKGMADEFLRLSIKYGYDTIPEDWKNGQPDPKTVKKRFTCRYSPAIFSLALCELLNELNVDIMFDTIITDTIKNNGHVESLVLFNKSGYIRCDAKMFVDATGDSDILNYSGVPTVTGGNYHTYISLYTNLDRCKQVVEDNDIAKLTTYKSGGNSNLYGSTHPENMPLWDGTNGDDVSNYIIKNQLQLLDNIRNDDRKTRDITTLPIMPQFRTTRHIDGNYTLKEDDAYKHFNDSICTICDFDRKDFLYEVPYGTLVKDGFDNIIAAGRCASASGYAWDVLRVIPPAILTGQAAGAAVCQAIDNRNSITDIDILTLQKKLESENVMIHFDDKLIPNDQSVIERVNFDHF